jgi:ferrous iron transport protein B
MRKSLSFFSFTHTKATSREAVTCHSGPQQTIGGIPLVVIVGSPNVGKSVLFNTLTGIYATVSNYPGTTVEVTRGKSRLGGIEAGVMDTPGMYSLLPITEEERVARRILLEERPDLVIHVIDAKNIERMLPMTLQLIEAGLPLMLVVNLLDEAEQLGLQLNLETLGRAIGVPVVGTALTLGRGVETLKQAIATHLQMHSDPGCLCSPRRFGLNLEHQLLLREALKDLEEQLQGAYALTRRAVALLLLQGDEETRQRVLLQESERSQEILRRLQQAQSQSSQPLALTIARQYRLEARRLLQPVLNTPQPRPESLRSRLSDWMIQPVTGLPILLAALVMLYLFVGVLGAQTLVGWMEGVLFGEWVNPWLDGLLRRAIPWAALRELVGGEFGLLTLGVRYAVAIVLPIVGTFFLAFSIIEDSGYLPRLALLIDRLFKKIGLNGRAVIPMVLGFGCDTMATIVTRTLETRRERLISTLLLSLAIPCSAQLGVMMALLSPYPGLAALWVVVVTGIFLLVGFLAAQLTPGERPTFYMELPPLRLPTLRNVLVKTYTRMEWYLREVIPLFLAASVLIWLGRISGLFDLTLLALKPVVAWLGLPQETTVAFLFGFFRRDYGAAGLYDLRGLLSPSQLVVAVTTMTLFIPCVAQFAVMIKERGWKTALGIAGFILPFSLLVGGLMNTVLKALGVE